MVQGDAAESVGADLCWCFTTGSVRGTGPGARGGAGGVVVVGDVRPEWGQLG